MARKRNNTSKKEDSRRAAKPLEEESSPRIQPRDDVDDLLSEMDAEVVIDEPDEMLLAREAEEITRLPEDESLELLKPALGVEMGEDPVRLYLSEIGEIDLLSVDHEFWLATRIEAARRVDVLNRGHPIARRGRYYSTSIYRALFDELAIGWKRLAEDAQRLGYNCPDLSLIHAEARMLRQAWNSHNPSYLRNYLDNGRWGVDHLWDQVAGFGLTVFICFYLFPDGLGTIIEKFLISRHRMPSQ